MTEQSTGDVLVADYLARVRRAGAGLPPDRVDELVEDLSAHIAAARAELGVETETALRTLLDRLGDPTAIIAEAAVGEPVAPPAPVAPPRKRGLMVTLLVLLGVVIIVPVLACAIGLVAFNYYQVGGSGSGVVVDSGPAPAPTRSAPSVESTG